MFELVFSTLWCFAQVALIATAAIVATALFMKHRPDVAATSLGWISLITMVLAIAVATPTPNWPVGLTEARTPVSTPGPDTDAVDEAPGVMFRLPSLKLGQAARETVVSLRQAAPSSKSKLAFFWLASVGMGLAHVILGLLSLRKLLRRCRPIESTELVYEVAADVAGSLACNGAIALMESDEVDCAAVVGLRKPTVLLASDWRDWEARELRAVLAHEIAHVTRRDAFWRVVSVFGLAAHYFNPFAHWLTARTVLAQELAADRLALQSMGQGVYVRSLSGLALRKDSTVRSSRVRTHSLFTPVFTGHLMRRIEMLVAKDCTDLRQGCRWISPLLVALIATLALVTTAARGLAAPQEEDQKKASPIQQVSGTADKKAGFRWFGREGVPSNHGVFTESGGIHCVVQPILKSPVLSTLGASLTEMIPALADADLSRVKSLSGNAHVQVRYGRLPNSATDVSQPANANAMSLGFSQFAVELFSDVDWKSCISQLPDVQKHGEGKGTYWTASLGEIRPALVTPSNHELRLHVPRSYKKDGTPRYDGLDRAAQETNTVTFDWKDDWEFVSGGIVTILWKTRIVGDPNEKDDDDDEFTKLFHELGEKTDVCAYGFDVDPGVTTLRIRCRFRCQKGVTALETRRLIERFLRTMHEQYSSEADADELSVSDAMIQSAILEAMSSADTEFQPGRVGDRENVSCELKLPIPPAIRAWLLGPVQKR